MIYDLANIGSLKLVL